MIATRTRSRLTAGERAASVAEATHSVELEGLTVSPASLADAQEYVRGTSTSTNSVGGSAPGTALPDPVA